MPVPMLVLQRHQSNLETAPGDGVEVNRNVGLTQLCNKQKAGKSHPFGILGLAVLAAKIRSGETPCHWVYFISEGSRVDLGCFPASTCPSGWGRVWELCPVPSDCSCLLVHSQVALGQENICTFGFPLAGDSAGLVFAVGKRWQGLLGSFAPRGPVSG